MNTLETVNNAKNESLEQNNNGQENEEQVSEKQTFSKLSKKERKDLKKKKKKALKKANKAKKKAEFAKKKAEFAKKKEELAEKKAELVDKNENTNSNDDNTPVNSSGSNDGKEKEEEEPDFPLYNYLIHEKELDNTMFIYNQRQKLADLKIYKVQPSEKYIKYIEFSCLHEDRIPGLIYLDGFAKDHKIIVNQKTVDLIRAQEATEKTDEEIAKLFIKYYGDSSDVVLSLMGLDPFEMKRAKSKKKEFVPLPEHSREDIEHEKQLDKMRFIHTEKNKAFNKIIKNMKGTTEQ